MSNGQPDATLVKASGAALGFNQQAGPFFLPQTLYQNGLWQWSINQWVEIQPNGFLLFYGQPLSSSSSSSQSGRLESRQVDPARRRGRAHHRGRASRPDPCSHRQARGLRVRGPGLRGPARDQVPVRGQDRVPDQARVRVLDQGQAQDRGQGRGRGRAQDLGPARDPAPDQAPGLDQDLARGLDQDRVPVPARDLAPRGPARRAREARAREAQDRACPAGPVALRRVRVPPARRPVRPVPERAARPSTRNSGTSATVSLRPTRSRSWAFLLT